MGKNLSKKYQVKNNELTIDCQPSAELFRKVRWQSAKAHDEHTVEGADDPLMAFCEQPVLELQVVDIENLTRITSDDIIDKFLRTDHHRIVAEEGDVQGDIVTEAEIDDEEDMVSEELAEIYLAQGLKDMAKETYRKLSLLNPEKSIYFAEIISKIDSNN